MNNRIYHRTYKKPYIQWILFLFILLSINGCSLAKKDAGEETGGDRLIGAFITPDYLDLFDMDAYLDDHASKIFSKKEFEISKSAEYEGRIYATVNKNGGEDPADWDISFGKIEGINFFSPKWTIREESYHSTCYGDGLCDTNYELNQRDDGEDITLSATLYILPGMADKETAYYVNPVYQTASGEIYVLSGQGFSTSGESGEGEVFSTTLSDTQTITIGRNTKTETITVKVHYSVMYEPVKITLYQMDEGHHILTSKKYIPGKLPRQLTPEKNMAYFLIETEYKNSNGKSSVTRKIFEKNDAETTSLETFYPIKNGILSKMETELLDNP